MNATPATRINPFTYLNALWIFVAFAVIALLSLRADAASSSTVITIAGDGSRGFSGDGGPATNAAITEVDALTVGPDGTIYLVDGGNYRIRAIDPATGHIGTVAGNGIPDNTGNGGPATNASISTTTSLTTDRARNVLYLSDINHNFVRRVNLADGVISIYAGTGTIGFTGDSGPATSARLRRPWGLATDAAGRLSIAAHYRVRQVNPVTGIINTIAGGDTSEFSPDGFPAVSTSFHGITELVADRAGNVFVFEGFSNEPRFVRRIDAVSGLVSTVAGGGTNAPGTGLATNMQFIQMFDIAVSAAGELFIAMDFEVFRVDLATGLIAPIAGNGTQGFGGDGGPALSAQFNGLSALAFIPGGGIVVADQFNFRIRYIAPNSINLTNDTAQTSFTLPWVSSLSGDLVISNNPSLTNINVSAVTNVGGVLSMANNTAAGVLDLSSLVSAGVVYVTGNTEAGVLSLGSLESAAVVEVSGNTAAGVLDLDSLTSVSGELLINTNAAAGNLDLSSLETAGTVEITGNTAAGEIDLSSLLTAGTVEVTGNTAAGVVDLGLLSEVSGDLTIGSNAPNTVVNLSELTDYGCGTNEVTMTLNGGTVEMTNGLTLCTNATLTGSTTVDGSVTNNGTIEPGSSPGRLNITRNLVLSSASRLRMEIGGYASNQFDVVNVGNSVALGGTLTVTLLNNFTNAMTNGASFTVLTAGAPLAGSFANVASGGTLITADGRGQFTVRYAGENTVRLTNLQLLGQPSASSGTILTIAGNGFLGFSGDGGPATNATMSDVNGLAIGSDGTIFFSDSSNYRVRAIDPITGIVRTVAGNGENGAEMNGPLATNAQMGYVTAVATDPARHALYLSEFDLHSVRKVNLVDGTLTIYAGSGPDGGGFAGDGGPAIGAKLTFQDGIATDAMGKLSIADAGNFRLRQVNPVTGIINTIAGSGTSVSSGDGGPAVSASFHGLTRVTADRAGNIYVLEGFSNQSKTVRRIDAITGIINTVAGGGTNTPGPGLATNMYFNDIIDIAANDAGELFVARTYSIFKLDLATGLIAPFAGDGTRGFSGDGGPALNARFNGVWALALVPGGGLLLADLDNVRIRYIAPNSINLTNDNGQTSFTLPWVSSLTGDLIISNNPSLTNINASTVTNVGGVISLGNNTAAGALDLSSLVSAGVVYVTGNTAATVLDLGSLESAAVVEIRGNATVGVLDLDSLMSVSGELVINSNSVAGHLDLSLLQTAGTVEITGNTAATELDLSSLLTAGTVEVSGNTNAGVVDLGSLFDVSGDLTIESNAPNTVISLSELTEYGCGTNEVTMTLNGGTVEMTNGLTLCTNGTLTGSTTVDGSVTNNGTIEPGSSPGRLNITGNLVLGSASRLRMEIGGYASNSFDVVNVGNGVRLGGTLTVTLLNSFTNAMTNGASFTVLTAGAPLAGSFANVASGGTLVTADGRGRFTVRYAGENTVRLTDLEILNGENADTDGDGMPDWWEDQFGLDKTVAGDALMDLDGDGSLNRDEFLAGTRPNDATSVFRLISIRAETNGVRLTWSAIGGRTYRVQTNGTLPGPFTDNGTLVTASGVGEFITNILNPNAIPNSSARYYRLRLGP